MLSLVQVTPYVLSLGVRLYFPLPNSHFYSPSLHFALFLFLFLPHEFVNYYEFQIN